MDKKQNFIDLFYVIEITVMPDALVLSFGEKKSRGEKEKLRELKKYGYFIDIRLQSSRVTSPNS